MKISRRQFLAGVGAAGAAVAADAFGFEAHRVLLTRHEVRIAGLPQGLDGLRTAQVSDVHFPGKKTAARAALEHLHHEHPDIVLLSGHHGDSRPVPMPRRATDLHVARCLNPSCDGAIRYGLRTAP